MYNFFIDDDDIFTEEDNDDIPYWNIDEITGENNAIINTDCDKCGETFSLEIDLDNLENHSRFTCHHCLEQENEKNRPQRLTKEEQYKIIDIRVNAEQHHPLQFPYRYETRDLPRQIDLINQSYANCIKNHIFYSSQFVPALLEITDETTLHYVISRTATPSPTSQ